MEKPSGLTFSISCAGEVESAAGARPCLSSSGPGGGSGPPGEAAQMADWSTVIFVPLMRFSSCPSIRGSHWSKLLSSPAEAEVRRRFGECCRGGRRRALTQVALQEGERRFVAEVDGDLGVDLSFQLHQLPDPVSCQEGEVGEALVHRPPGEGRKEGRPRQTRVTGGGRVRLRYLMVIILRWVTGESSFLMRLMFPAHWNFSELMKKSGCLTPGKVSSSRGNIQASSATPHLNREKPRSCPNTRSESGSKQKRLRRILESLLLAEGFDHCRASEGMTHDGYPTQIHGVLVAERRV